MGHAFEATVQAKLWAKLQASVRYLTSLRWAGALCVLLLAGHVQAAYEEIYNVDAATIPQGLTQEKIVQAIKTGGAQRGWVIDEQGPGHLLATLNIRSHTVRADIRYNTTSYSITYKDSVNMKFKKGRIHGAYNKWVRNLEGDIQRALMLVAL